MNEKEVELAKLLYEFPEIIAASAESYNPSVIANYLYDLAKEFNQFYHDFSVLSAESEEIKLFRLQICSYIGKVIFNGMDLLGIEVPERM